MKVIDVKTRKTLDENDAYGARLIEQGMAVPAPAKAEEPAKAKKAANKDDAK